MGLSGRRKLLADALGLATILFVLFDYLRPSLLLLPTIPAGGDTPCHYPSAVFFEQELLPRLRVHGWYAGAYLGHPLFLYYFPLPFLGIAALTPLFGLPVAFKIGIVLPVFLLPLLVYACLRFFGFAFPTPLVGAAFALLFLFVEDNPIWGGTLASTLTGEFCYTYGIAAAVLFLGVCYRAYTREGGVTLPAIALAATALSHGYCVLWAGLSASFFLFGSRRPLWTLGWLLRVGSLGFALAAFWILPLLADWSWTTPYNDPWITAGFRNLFPPLLWPSFLLALFGLAFTLTWERRRGGADRRLLFLGYSALVGVALASFAPWLGVIDVRLVPLAQLAVVLVGAAFLGSLLGWLVAPDCAALALVALFALEADTSSQNLRPWIDWDFQGLQAKELWGPYMALSRALKGDVSDPRVAVEYSKEHERAGSIRIYETLPLFSGRSTLEGVYNQASLLTHEVYYVASELDEVSPNPFRSRDYSSFDTDSALVHLRLFNVRDIVALSAKLTLRLREEPQLEEGSSIPPYTLFHFKEPGSGYVEPVAYQPFRSRREGWRDKAFFFFTRKPMSPAPVVFTDDARFPPLPDEVLPPPLVPFPSGVVVRSTLSRESITISTSAPGHPLLVKVSYHPRWRAIGADGPYLVSPGLMLVVPREPHVQLVYDKTASDRVGALLTLLGCGVVLIAPFGLRFRSRQPDVSPALLALAGCEPAPSPPRRWGGWIPGGLILLGLLGRLHRPPDKTAEVRGLLERARTALATGRGDDAAEYARAGLFRRPEKPLRLEFLLLRGEGLLRRDPAAAETAFAEVATSGASPVLAEALYYSVEAGEAVGDHAKAETAREKLLSDFPKSPFAEKLRHP